MADKESEHKMLWGLTVISLIALCNAKWFKPNGNTSQSSTHVDRYHYRAIDGNVSACAHTQDNQKLNPWWTIDLLDVYEITTIAIYNVHRTNIKINHAQIHIGNFRHKNFTTDSLCKNITVFPLDRWNCFTCTRNMSGRYISVFLPTKNFLVVCEMRIDAIKKESPFELIKEEKSWEDALYYCRERNMDLAPILTEEHQAWAELKAMEADTSSVWLALHYSCVLDYWFWVTDHPLQFENWAPNNKTRQCDMNGAMEKGGDHHWISIHHDTKLNFICTKQCDW